MSAGERDPTMWRRLPRRPADGVTDSVAYGRRGPARGAITAADAKPIFIQANGSLEGDDRRRHTGCTPGVGAAADSSGSLCFWRAAIGSPISDRAEHNEQRHPAALGPQCFH